MTPTSSGSRSQEPLPPVELSKAVASIFSASECLGADVAQQELESLVYQLTLTDWRVTVAASVRPGDCVGASIQVEPRRILLLPAASPALRLAIDRLQDSLLATCFGEAGARTLVNQVLADAGLPDWQIDANGPEGGPVDRFDQVMRHLDAGCFVYSGTGWTADGTRIIYLTGKR
jgi:hypothetical protein